MCMHSSFTAPKGKISGTSIKIRGCRDGRSAKTSAIVQLQLISPSLHRFWPKRGHRNMKHDVGGTGIPFTATAPYRQFLVALVFADLASLHPP